MTLTKKELTQNFIHNLHDALAMQFNKFLSIESSLISSSFRRVGFIPNSEAAKSSMSFVQRPQKNIDLKISSEEDHPELSC